MEFSEATGFFFLSQGYSKQTKKAVVFYFMCFRHAAETVCNDTCQGVIRGYGENCNLCSL